MVAGVVVAAAVVVVVVEVVVAVVVVLVVMANVVALVVVVGVMVVVLVVVVVVALGFGCARTRSRSAFLRCPKGRGASSIFARTATRGSTGTSRCATRPQSCSRSSPTKTSHARSPRASTPTRAS